MSLTLLLQIDAFRRDYVSRTRCVRRLAAEGRTGALTEDFGFVPRGAYFAGLGPASTGFTHMYCCDPVASPFGVARGVPESPLGREVEDALGIRTWVESEARARTTPYAASFLTSAEIPLSLLPSFDIVEKHAPWDAGVGYRSLFHELNDRGLPYFTAAWPHTATRHDATDRAIVTHTLSSVRPPCRFAFVQLSELNAVGQTYGPESREILAAIDATDALVETLLDELGRRFDRVDLVLFGDHGMVPVVRTVDVHEALRQADLLSRHDLVFFLDPTMARFWPTSAGVKDRVIRALADLPGRMLDEADLGRLHLSACDPRNGELMFLVNPGVLIAPNFVIRRGHPIRGMHGYDPSCPDNQGLFLLHEPGGTPHVDIGLVRPRAIYGELCRLLSIPSRRPRARPTMLHVAAPAMRAFTQDAAPEAREMIDAHLARIVETTRQLVPCPDAIVLTGAFGRDEGCVTFDPEGRPVPVGGYDVVVVGADAPDTPSAHDWQELCRALAEEFHADAVRVRAWPHIDAGRALTLAHFDIRYGSRVIWGDAGVLDRLPRFAAAAIPLFEGVQLLLTRLARLLTARRVYGHRDSADERRAFSTAIILGATALGDWRLLREGAYDASARVRRQRVTWLASGLGIGAAERNAILTGYRFLLEPDDLVATDMEPLGYPVIGWLVRAAVDAIGRHTRRAVTTAVEAAAAYLDATTTDATWVDRDNAHARRVLDDDRVVGVCPDATQSVRQSLYASVLALSGAVVGEPASLAWASSRLDRCLTPPWPADQTPENFERVRSRLSHAWLRLVS